MSNNLINVEKLVPEKLREKPLYDKVVKLLDYIIEQYYQNNYEAIKHAYDVFFDPQVIYKVLADKDLKELLQLSDQDGVELVWLLNLMQRLRGTRKGLDFFLRLVQLTESVIVDRRLDSNIDPCKVRVEVSPSGIGTTYLDIERVVRIFSLYLHICVELDEINFKLNFTLPLNVSAYGSPFSEVIYNDTLNITNYAKAFFYVRGSTRFSAELSNDNLNFNEKAIVNLNPVTATHISL